jgi:hypothetical protein
MTDTVLQVYERARIRVSARLFVQFFGFVQVGKGHFGSGSKYMMSSDREIVVLSIIPVIDRLAHRRRHLQAFLRAEFLWEDLRSGYHRLYF